MLMATRDSMPGQVHAQADVDTEAEAHVLAHLAEHVVGIGVGVLALIPVGGTEHQGHVGALLDRHAGQLGVSGGPAEDDRYRRFPTEDFLEGLGVQGAVPVERVELGPVGEQAEEEVARWPGRWSRPRPGGAGGGTSRSPRR